MPRYRAATTAAMTTALEAVKAFCDEESADDWPDVRKKVDEALELAHADQGRPESPNPFDGSDYNPALDDDRLRTQLGKIFNVMADGEQHTLTGIAHRIGGNAPEASISAQLRHLRKAKHGSWIIDKIRDPTHKALFLYQMRNPDGTTIPPLKPLQEENQADG